MKFEMWRELPTLRHLLLLSTMTHLLTIPVNFFYIYVFFLKNLSEVKFLIFSSMQNCVYKNSLDGQQKNFP